MIYTSKWLWLSIGKFLPLLLYLVIVLGAQEVSAQHHISDSSITPQKDSEVDSLERDGNGRTRRQEPTSPDYEHIYKTLYERGLFKMCSIMRNSDQQELNQTLGKSKEFTILAPSDEAFNLIPGSQFEEIKSDKQKRQEFIRQHIIPNRILLNSFRAFDEREELNANGLKLHITAYPNGFVINGANVLEGDIPVPNSRGLVQVVDKVLYPQKQVNLLEVLEENPHLTQISSFLALSGLQKELTTNDSFTFFAPNDEAFRAVPWPVTQQMLSNNTFLRLLIANHVIPGKQYSAGLAGNTLSSIGGNLLNFTSRTVQSHSLVLVNLIPILDSDLIATNGVVQVITRIMLPKELMDDCNCLKNETTSKPNELAENTTLSNETMSTMDPLIKEMLASDPRFNNIDRRIGSTPTSKPQSGDHFTSTPKPVSFKSIWDDIFGSPEENTTTPFSGTEITANATLTTLVSPTNGSTPSTASVQNTTDLPFYWDFLTTQSPRTTTNQSTEGFTIKPTVPQNETLLPEMMSRLRHFTPGVVYEDETNGTTILVNTTTTSDTATTSGAPSSPSSWTRPFYRPERIKNRAEPTATTQNLTTTTVTETPLTIGNSFFRPTLKPKLRSSSRDATDPQSNTVPPYDRRLGLQRDRTPLESRSRMGPQPGQTPVQQIREDDNLEQRIEPMFRSNRTQDPYQRDSNYSVPQSYQPQPPHQPYQRPAYRPESQPQSYRPSGAQQPSPYSPQFNRTQGLQRVRPPYDSEKNRTGDTPEDYQNVEQKPYSPTSWSQPQFSPYSPQNISAQTLGREPKADSQNNWWDSRYEPPAYPMRSPPESKGGQQTQQQQPRHPIPASRSSSPSAYPQSSQVRAQRPRVLIPGVVYTDEERTVPQYYRPAAKDGLTRPYYQPNATIRNTYPQSPYYRRAQPSPPSRKTQTPSRDVYSRPELIDRSYVPQYNPYMTDTGPPQMVVGEYPYVYGIDHSQYPSGQYMPSPQIDPYSRGQRVGPYDRRRPASPAKGGYGDIRRRGDKPFQRPADQKPQTPPDSTDSDLKTISEIMESPDLMIGQKFKTFNTLKDLVNGSGLWEALNRPTTFITIFMPTDDAFDAITDGSVEQLKRNPKLVKDFLTQHILGYSLPPQNLKNNIRVKSLNGEMHLINVIENGKIMIDGIDVIAATTSKNGNVYVLDKIMEGTGRRSRSIVDELKKRPDLSTFSALVQRSELNKVLSEESGPFTLLVPNNKALNKMNLRELIKTQKDLNDFMKKHLIEGAVYSNQLSPNKSASLVADPSSDIRRIGLTSDAPISINNSTQVITPDISTENGVIHVIDSILDQKINITDDSRVESQPSESGSANEETNRNAKQLSITRPNQNHGIRRFTNWLKKSGIIDDLVKDGRQYTVIVPTDRAVGKLPLKIQSILNSEPTRLTNLLEYHVIPGFVDTKSLNDNEMLTTINNRKIRFTKLDNGRVIMFSGAPVNRQSTEQNLQIISVDTVLYPPQGTIPDLVTKSPLLKTLNEIIKTAQMEDELRNSTDITLFAPKDEAFKQMDSQILERLKTDQNYSREFLRKHIMPKVMFTSALQNMDTNIQREPALSGETLKIFRKPNCVSVNGIILSFADITATNGVLHIIDHTI